MSIFPTVSAVGTEIIVLSTTIVMLWLFPAECQGNQTGFGWAIMGIIAAGIAIPLICTIIKKTVYIFWERKPKTCPQKNTPGVEEAKGEPIITNLSILSANTNVDLTPKKIEEPTKEEVKKLTRGKKGKKGKKRKLKRKAKKEDVMINDKKEDKEYDDIDEDKLDEEEIKSLGNKDIKKETGKVGVDNSQNINPPVIVVTDMTIKTPKPESDVINAIVERK